MKYSKILALTLAASAANVTYAAEEEEGKLQGSAELGYVITSGNSETSTLNGKLGLSYEEEVWKNTLKIDSLSSKATDQDTGEEKTTAQRLIVENQYDYKFSAKGYMFGAIEYDKDDVSTAYDHFINYTLGYGRTLIKDKEMKLAFETGYGIRSTEYESLLDAGTDQYVQAPDSREEILRVKGDFSWKITPTTKFTQLLRSDIGLSNNQGDNVTLTRSESALSVKINSRFAMKTAYIIEHRSDVAEGVENKDTKLAITLVYSI